MRILDTETTGLNRTGEDKIVQIAIIDEQTGKTLLYTHVNPERDIPKQASNIHGITSDMVKIAPTIDDLESTIIDILDGQELIIYNAGYDMAFLPESVKTIIPKVHCCMERFSKFYGDWNDYYQNYKWQSLAVAADYVNYLWQDSDAHDALEDCLATRAVWQYLDKQNKYIFADGSEVYAESLGQAEIQLTKHSEFVDVVKGCV